MPAGIPSAKTINGPSSPLHAAHTNWRSPLPWGPILSTGQGKDKCFADTLGYEPSLHSNVPQLLIQALWPPGPLGCMIPAGLEDKKHLPPQLLGKGTWQAWGVPG